MIITDFRKSKKEPYTQLCIEGELVQRVRLQIPGGTHIRGPDLEPHHHQFD